MTASFASGSGRTPLRTVAASGAAQSLVAPSHGEVAYQVTLTANCIFTPSGGSVGEACSILLRLFEDASANHTATLAGNVTWGGQVPPSLNLSMLKHDLIQLITFDGGVTFDGMLVSSALQPITVPSAPVSPGVLASNAQNVFSMVAASNGGSPITGYNIYRGTSSGGETLLASNQTVPYTDTGRTNGTNYYYQSTAVNLIGESARSVEVAGRAGHYLSLTGALADGATTPNLLAQNPTTTVVSLRAYVTRVWSTPPSGNVAIFGKWDSGKQQYLVYIDVNNKLQIGVIIGGSYEGLPSTVALTAPDNTGLWLRADSDPAGTQTFYTAIDGGAWSILGAPVSIAPGTMTVPGTPGNLSIGVNGAAGLNGRIHRAQMYNGASLVADCDLSGVAAASATWLGTTGETWTKAAAGAVV